MYKIVIVDDERVVRLALHNMIEWEEMDVELIGEAKDGQEALDMIDEYGAQIVITDLKMPNMDGITLIKELKEKNYKGKILVLSNYDDFNRVKEAMKLGVTDYMLKVTMKVQDLKEAIAKMIKLLDEDKAQKAKNVDSQIQVRRGEKLYREKVLRSILLEKPESKEKLTQQIDEMDLHVQLENNLMFYIQLDALSGALDSQKIKDVQLLSFSIKNIISEITNRRTVGEIVDVSHKEFALLVPAGQIENALSLAKRISYMLNMYINLSVSIVIAEGRGMELWQTLSECRTYISCKFYHGSNDLMYLNQPPISYEMDVDHEKNLREMKAYIYNKEWNKVKKIFLSILKLGERENTYPQIIKNLCIVMMDQIVNIQKNNELWSYKQLEEELSSIEFMEDYNLKIDRLIGELERNAESEMDGNESVVTMVERYIITNLDKKITLRKVAEYVHLNPSYLSRLFKQVKGVSLIDFSNQIKIEKAKEVLQQEKISIQEVGRSIGIQDPYYFNKVFKKYVGISPSIYKKSLNNN